MEKNNQQIIVPTIFQLTPFYVKNTSLNFPTNIKIEEGITQYYFLYEILHYLKIDAPKPWQEPDSMILFIFNQWKQNKEQMTAIYQKKDWAQAKKIIPSYISMWISALFWTHKQPIMNVVEWKKEIKELSFLPINLEERLSFILDRPSHYHSFIQLSELYIELEKLYYKSRL